ncbi:MAG: hypothetical protein ACTSQJ_16715 [Promethearchaeota archaeon]
MEDKNLFILNIIAIISFIFYAIGIYIQVVFQGILWGNLIVFTLLRTFGNEFGVVMVVIIGGGILLTLYFLPKFRSIDIFFCWFFILSLYQCAINSFLQFNNLPDEPINQFFKFFFPNFWYPAKEIIFILISIMATIIWLRKISKEEIKAFDIFLILISSISLIIVITFSQILLINA